MKGSGAASRQQWSAMRMGGRAPLGPAVGAALPSHCNSQSKIGGPPKTAAAAANAEPKPSAQGPPTLESRLPASSAGQAQRAQEGKGGGGVGEVGGQEAGAGGFGRTWTRASKMKKEARKQGK